ncbi:MAG: hypothetical protein GWN86_24575, partial [Desulfobacterales bacterium]|nr:hypothetical protein [Desulfobacterales bacterium]
MPKFGEQYTKKFQQESIRCLAQDIKFAEQCVGILQPDYFDNDMHGFAAEGIISHLTRH